jgi:hypothetical protein
MLTPLLRMAFWSWCFWANMAYPYNVDLSIVIPEATWAQNIGPFQYGSEVFGVFVDAVNSNLEVWSSADAGVTWAERDAANHPAIKDYWVGSLAIQEYRYQGFRCVSVARDGATLYIAYLVQSIPDGDYGEINIRAFSMATRTWGATITGGPMAWAWINHGTTPATLNGPAVITLGRKSDGSFAVAYTSEPETVVVGAVPLVCKRTSYATYSGGAWSSETAFPDQAGTYFHFQPATLVIGASDRAHLFVVKSARTFVLADPETHVFTGRLLHLTIGQSVQHVTGQVLVISHAAVGKPAVYESGGQTYIAVPYAESGASTNEAKIAIAASADAPSWTLETIHSAGTYPPAPAPPTYSIALLSAVHNGTALECYWGAGNGSTFGPERVVKSTRGATTWGDVSDMALHVGGSNYFWTVHAGNGSTGGTALFLTNLYYTQAADIEASPFYWQGTAAGAACRYYGI